MRLPRHVRRAFEEERHRHLQDVRDLLQPARADAVRALLVLLHLLEGEAERVAELFLTHAEHHAAHTHACAHVLVGRIGRLLRHHVVCSAPSSPIKSNPLLLTDQTRAQSVNYLWLSGLNAAAKDVGSSLAKLFNLRTPQFSGAG